MFVREKVKTFGMPYVSESTEIDLLLGVCVCEKERAFGMPYVSESTENDLLLGVCV